MIKIIDLLASITFGLLLMGFGKSSLQYIDLKTISFIPEMFYVGAATYIIISRLGNRFIKENLTWYKVFMHERIHVIIAMCFFKTIPDFKASHYNGGYMKYSGGIKVSGTNFIINLAPYFLSILPLFLIVLQIYLIPKAIVFSTFLIGFTLAFHLNTFYEQSIGHYLLSRKHQSDIGGSRFYSVRSAYLFIVLMNLIITSIIVLGISNPDKIGDFILFPLKSLLKTFSTLTNGFVF